MKEQMVIMMMSIYFATMKELTCDRYAHRQL